MSRNIIDSKPWVYTIVEENGRYFFEVVSGGVGLYDKRREISEEDAKNYAEDKVLAERLAQEIDQSS